MHELRYITTKIWYAFQTKWKQLDRRRDVTKLKKQWRLRWKVRKFRHGGVLVLGEPE